MGIKSKNMDEQDFVLIVPGAVAADANLDQNFAKFSGYIHNGYGEMLGAGVTGSTIADVNKNGTTIFSAAPKITFTAAAAASSYSALSSEAVTKGDKFSLDVDSIHTGTAPDGLAVHIRLGRRPKPGGATNVAPSALP
jgi:hypothetical protein